MPKKEVPKVPEKILAKIDRDLWQQFRLYCLANSTTCFDQVNEIIKNFLQEKQFHVKVKRD